MREQMLTPVDLWKDYYPSEENLQVNIVKHVNEDKRRVNYVYISGAGEIENVRIALKSVCPSDVDKCPCFFYIPGFNGTPNEKIIDQMLKNRIAVVTFEYLGKEIGDMHATKYDASVSFAAAPTCFNNLESAYPTVKRSPWYIWSLMARRVLYYIATDGGFSDEIMVFGESEGSMMAWHVAAFDDRITCMAETGGFYPASIEKIENKAPLVPDNLRWIAGLTPEAYVKYVNCPVLTMTATNSSIETLDRHDKILLSLPAETERYLALTPMSEHELSPQSFNTLVQFALKFLTGNEKPEFPRLLELEDSYDSGICKFRLKTEADARFTSVQLVYSCGLSHPKNRAWMTLPMKREKGEYVLYLDASNMSDNLNAFINVTRGGCVFSTPFESLALPANPGVRHDDRILFEGRQGTTGVFTSNTGGLFWNEDDFKLKAGAYGIEGLYSRSGVLQSFIFQNASFKPTVDSILRFDAYSETEKTFKIALYSDEGVRYDTECRVAAAPYWQQIKLPTDAFKRELRISLGNWDDIIKIVFEGVDGVLINNLLWL